jgi:photosystem II stability/assembly factor-like uncharacterized protein
MGGFAYPTQTINRTRSRKNAVAREYRKTALDTHCNPTARFKRWLTGWCMVLWLQCIGFPNACGIDTPRAIADGVLYDCSVLSLDNAIAVGERGLILRTEDGGKSWSSISPRSDYTYFSVGWDATSPLEEQRRGLIVGGRIDPISGRSEGVVEFTQDNGKTWTRSKVVGMPRLLGAQRIQYQHWIAWGDWSDHWQSSLFVTTDGGKTWSARPTPSGHLRCAAADANGQILVIDRHGSAFHSTDGIEFQPIAIELDPFRPLRFCKATENGWWIGGDHGQLYRSSDGVRWSRLSLPGTLADQALFQLSDAVIRGSRVWVVGSPGTAIWHSANGGQRWSVATTDHAVAFHAIDALDDDVLWACGDSGRIALTRNGGSAWLDCHLSGSRVACQTIASTRRNVPWDALAYVVHESKRRASALIVHDQHYQSVSNHQPEVRERIREAGCQVGLEKASILHEFPVGDLRTGIRSTDLGYYQHIDPSQSELIRRLAFEIRCARPDLLIAEDTASKHSLDAATALATQHAIQLAGSPSYQCFSPQSGVTLPEWTVQRMLLRGQEAGGLTFAPSLLLQSSSLLLSEAMQPARHLAIDDPSDGKSAVLSKHSYRISTQRTTSIRHPLDGMLLDRSTQLIDVRSVKRKMATMVAASNLPSKVAQLHSTRGMGLWAEGAWDDALNNLSKDLPSDVWMEALWDLARDSRQAGNWHRWNTALNLIIERNPEGSMAERAYWELMRVHGSPEVHRLIQDQWSHVQNSKSDANEKPEVVPASQSSPFASATPVTLASFDNTARITPIARMKGIETFSRYLSRWPESWQTHRTEPEWAWLIASRFRSNSLLRGIPPAEIKDNVHWPPTRPGPSVWTQIHIGEQELLSNYQTIANPGSNAGPISGLTEIPFLDSRPFLDGKCDEACWPQAAFLELRSAWADSKEPTQIRLARDADFLFLYSKARKTASFSSSNRPSPSSSANAGRKRDALDSESDHIRFRLDLDRDYASWFELAWDAEGMTLDQCNDMKWWDPEWFIAVSQEGDYWTAELAIPLSSLIPTPMPDSLPSNRSVASGVVPAGASEPEKADNESIDWAAQTWAISIVRERPSDSLESVPVCELDRWTPQHWILATPQQAAPLQPE